MYRWRVWFVVVKTTCTRLTFSWCACVRGVCVVCAWCVRGRRARLVVLGLRGDLVDLGLQLGGLAGQATLDGVKLRLGQLQPVG